MSFPKPSLFEATPDALESFSKTTPVDKTIDVYDEMLEELFLVRNPRFKFIPSHTEELAAWKEDLKSSNPALLMGTWAYFPWSKLAIHVLPSAEHLEVRTARNRNLISSDEQQKFYNARVAVAGLSVGSHGALTLALTGGARFITIADPDTISISNLNRIRYDCTAIGRKKAEMVAEYIYQLDPYAEVGVFEGVTEENIDEFLGGSEPVDVLIEEIDNLEMKIRLRLKARELGIPVVMVTDNGDGVIVDVERYDLDPNTELFNGAIGHVTLDEFRKFVPSDMPKLATKVAGVNIVVPRMLQSLLLVGREIYSWPQMGSAATLAGVVIAYVARKIILGEEVRTGKFEVSLDAIFDPAYHTDEAIKAREEIRDMFKQTVGLS